MLERLAVVHALADGLPQQPPQLGGDHGDVGRRSNTRTRAGVAALREVDELLVADQAVAVLVEFVDEHPDLAIGEVEVQRFEAVFKVHPRDLPAAVPLEMLERLLPIVPSSAHTRVGQDLLPQFRGDLFHRGLARRRDEPQEVAVLDVALPRTLEAGHQLADLAIAQVEFQGAQALLEVLLVDVAAVVCVEVLERSTVVHPFAMGFLNEFAKFFRVVVNCARGPITVAPQTALTALGDKVNELTVLNHAVTVGVETIQECAHFFRREVELELFHALLECATRDCTGSSGVEMSLVKHGGAKR